MQNNCVQVIFLGYKEPKQLQVEKNQYYVKRCKKPGYTIYILSGSFLKTFPSPGFLRLGYPVAKGLINSHDYNLLVYYL